MHTSGKTMVCLGQVTDHTFPPSCEEKMPSGMAHKALLIPAEWGGGGTLFAAWISPFEAGYLR